MHACKPSLFSHVWLFATLWTVACQVPPSMGFSRQQLLLLLFGCPVVSDCFQPHGLQQVRPLCPSPPPRVCPSSCSLHQWCCPAISSSMPFSFPTTGIFPMSHLFESDDQNTGASASASVLPMNIQGWSPLRVTSLISLLSKRLSGVFSSTTVWRHQLSFCLLYGPVLTMVCDHWKDHSLDYMDLCWQSNVSQHTRVCHHFPAKKQSSSDFMAAVTVLCDFGVKEEEIFFLFFYYYFFFLLLLPPFPLLFAMQ